ncbi:MAG: hypothetical protein B7Y80_19615 [Hyphomicrobium sp. 32-62-53]|nr:MAG: hypothetical protein B7Y80_19615 [Hyphomicrobium sp. 32-62-53]
MWGPPQTLAFARSHPIYLIATLGLFCAAMSGAFLDYFGVKYLFFDASWPDGKSPWGDISEEKSKLQLLFLSPSFNAQYHLTIALGATYLFWSSGRFHHKGSELVRAAKDILGFAPIPLTSLAVALLTAPSETGPLHTHHASLGTAIGAAILFLWFVLASRQADAADVPRSLSTLRKWISVRALLATILLILGLGLGSAIQAPIDGIALYLLICTLLTWFIARAPATVFVTVLAGLCIARIWSLQLPVTPGNSSLVAVENTPLTRAASSDCSTNQTPASLPLVFSPDCALDAWKASKAADEPAKLVVVMASGGAYRAGFWVANILDTLVELSKPGEPLDGFIRDIRVLTGASGGMVASAYFTALMPEISDQRPIETAMVADILSGRDDPQLISSIPERVLAGDVDSLTPVIRRFFKSDLPGVLLGDRGSIDRGRELELSWTTLNRFSFRELATLEQKGKRPSIILTPTVADLGIPLFITNLALLPLAAEPSNITPLFNNLPLQQLHLRLATAVRANATFPLITPAMPIDAAALGSAKGGQVDLVDAGYLDNRGLDAALAYLLQTRVVDWVKRNNVEVIILDINAWPEEDTLIAGRAAISTGYLPSLDAFRVPGTAIMRARSRNELTRDQMAKALLAQAYAKAGNVTPVRWISFRNTQEIGMSWYITHNERKNLRREVCQAHNRNAFTQLAIAWKNRNTAPIKLPCDEPAGP